MDKMQKIVLIFLIPLLIFWFCALFMFGRNDPTTAAARELEVEKNIANRTVSDIFYVKDARTGLCFACRIGPSSGLATVQCEKIPPKMLTIAGITENQK